MIRKIVWVLAGILLLLLFFLPNGIDLFQASPKNKELTPEYIIVRPNSILPIFPLIYLTNDENGYKRNLRFIRKEGCLLLILEKDVEIFSNGTIEKRVYQGTGGTIPTHCVYSEIAFL